MVVLSEAVIKRPPSNKGSIRDRGVGRGGGYVGALSSREFWQDSGAMTIPSPPPSDSWGMPNPMETQGWDSGPLADVVEPSMAMDNGVGSVMLQADGEIMRDEFGEPVRRGMNGW